MSKGTWPGRRSKCCNWQHFSISAAIWFSTGLSRNTVHNLLQPVNHCVCPLEFRSRSSFYRRCEWQRLKWLLSGSPQVAKAGRPRKRCAMAWRTGEGAARQRMALESLSSSSPFWKITILVFDVSDFHSFSLTRGKYKTFGRIESFRMKITMREKS